MDQTDTGNRRARCARRFALNRVPVYLCNAHHTNDRVAKSGSVSALPLPKIFVLAAPTGSYDDA